MSISKQNKNYFIKQWNCVKKILEFIKDSNLGNSFPENFLANMPLK